MPGLRVGEWCKLPVSLKELCINTTLRCGQSFRWRKSGEDEWSIALHGRLLSLRQDSQYLHYRSGFPCRDQDLSTSPAPKDTHMGKATEDDTRELIEHYFNLKPDLCQLYEEWAASDANFAKKAVEFGGIRILKQDAWEALVGFICSSNNNIARISQMVEKLCLNYGPLIGYLNQMPYHDFPSPIALSGPEVEQHLRQLGFGYRAKYIWQTAKIISEKHDGWLDTLRNPESPLLGMKARFAGEWKVEGRDGYRTAHEELLNLQGVGPKVADCVCLMGLGWGESVPIDTHVWQIAQRDYKFGKSKHSSLTKATYDAVANKFRALWGKEAGWAHSVLFTADLKVFSERLTTKVKIETDTVEASSIKDRNVKIEVHERSTKLLKRKVKRLPEEEEHQVLEVQDQTVKRTKRRRRA